MQAEIRGRDLVTGLPKTVDALLAGGAPRRSTSRCQQIIDAIKSTLDKTPPELASDIMDRGIVLAGGGALLHRLRRAPAPRDRDAGARRRVAAHLRRGRLGPLARGVRRDPPRQPGRREQASKWSAQLLLLAPTPPLQRDRIPGHRPRDRAGAHRVPADLEHRAPAHRPRLLRLGRPGRRLHRGRPARDDGRRAPLLPRATCGGSPSAWLRSRCATASAAPQDLDARLGWYIILGTIPIAILGLAFKDQIENEFRTSS